MKKLAVSLGLLGALNAGASQAVELVPLSYGFDQATDCGTYCYHDSSGSELIDGIYGAEGWAADLGRGNAAEWVGWAYNSPVNIDFDFGQAVTIARIDIGTTQDNVFDVVLPSVEIFYGDDASHWIFAGSLSVPESSANDKDAYSTAPHGFLTLTNLDMGAARYIRVALLHSANGPWTFTDEIDFQGAPVPEPGTWALMLGGLGLLAAAGRRRAG